MKSFEINSEKGRKKKKPLKAKYSVEPRQFLSTGKRKFAPCPSSSLPLVLALFSSR